MPRASIATTVYDWRSLGETSDCWRYVVFFDERPRRPDNEFALQFTYDHDDSSLVQIKLDVSIPSEG